MARHTLFVSSRSPFSRKVLLAAQAVDVLHEYSIRDVAVSQARTDVAPELLEVNPLAQIPSLRTADGAAIFDSRVICRWIDKERGGGGLFPHDTGELHGACLREALSDGLMTKLLRRSEELRRPEAAQSSALLVANEATCQRTLDYMDQLTLARGAEDWDIGDIGFLVSLDYIDFRVPELNWRRDRTALQSWRQAQHQRGRGNQFPFK